MGETHEQQKRVFLVFVYLLVNFQFSIVKEGTVYDVEALL